jgi:hypothetical protein
MLVGVGDEVGEKVSMMMMMVNLTRSKRFTHINRTIVTITTLATISWHYHSK